MVGPNGLRGIFDWEFGHLGDPAEDLAWPCVRSWRFGHDALRLGGVGKAEDFFDAYRQAGGPAVDHEAVHYWEILGNLRWAVGCIAQANRHLSGQAPSIELASLGRRTAEMELELLDLIEQTLSP
jgi:aminoglycoside phosphotransferase (APT) family kinase protein